MKPEDFYWKSNFPPLSDKEKKENKFNYDTLVKFAKDYLKDSLKEMGFNNLVVCPVCKGDGMFQYRTELGDVDVEPCERCETVGYIKLEQL